MFERSLHFGALPNQATACSPFRCCAQTPQELFSFSHCWRTASSSDTHGAWRTFCPALLVAPPPPRPHFPLLKRSPFLPQGQARRKGGASCPRAEQAPRVHRLVTARPRPLFFLPRSSFVSLSPCMQEESFLFAQDGCAPCFCSCCFDPRALALGRANATTFIDPFWDGAGRSLTAAAVLVFQ